MAGRLWTKCGRSSQEGGSVLHRGNRQQLDRRRQRAIDELPSLNTTLQMARPLKSCFLGRLHGHGGPLSKRAIKYKALGPCLRELMQETVELQVFRQIPIGQMH